MKNPSKLFLRSPRSPLVSRAVIEWLEDRKLLSVNLPAGSNNSASLGIQLDAVPLDESAPTVDIAATATPNPVTGTTTNLSVLGDDIDGESTLTYTWVATGTPPAGVAFSINGTNDAKNTVASFTEAGAYSFEVAITNAQGLTAVSDVAVAVSQTLTSAAVVQSNVILYENSTENFTAIGYDQFGAAMSNQPAFSWTETTGFGSIDSISGIYTSPGTIGAANVVATSGSISASAPVAVIDAAPTIQTAASASPSVITGQTTALSVLGADDGGENNLTYTWTATALPTGVQQPSYSIDGTNAAKNTTATFYAAGNYTFTVTLFDGQYGTTTSTVNVSVDQTFTSLSITSNTLVGPGSSTQLTAAELDQFGIAMATQPTVAWSLTSGVGSVSATGLYTAGAVAGSAVVNAIDSNGLSANVALTVAAPTAWYQADSSTGTSLIDSSGNNQTGTLTSDGADFGPGFTGNALNLFGGYASLPAGIVGSVNDFTIAAWVKLPALTAGAHLFDFGTGTTDYMYLAPDANNTGLLTFGISTGGKSAEQQVVGPAISPGAWTYLAVTLAGHSAKLYVNGSSVAAGTVTLNPSSLGTTTLNYLGKSQFSTDPALIGSIDDFRIYSTALSAQQLQQVATLSIPAGWTDSDIGGPTLPGSAFYVPGTGVWTVTTGGANIYNTADQANFVGTILGGDLVLTAEVTSVGNTSNYAQAGLMIRGSTYAGAEEVSLLMTPGNGIEFLVRQGDDQATTFYGWSGINGPVWLQLDRYGSDYFGYFSNDDVNWYQVGPEISVPMIDPVLAGLAATSAVTGSVSVSTFSNVSIANNAPPTLASAAAASQTNFVGYSTQLSVLGADDAGLQNLTYNWADSPTDPAPVSFSASGTNSAKITQATFTTSGTYHLVATITDAGGYTVQSNVTVTVSVPPASPVGISAQWNGSSVSVAWQPVTGAASYNVYRATTVGGEGATPYATGISAGSVIDNAVTAGTSYYYQITAVDSLGKESARSFEVATLSAPYTTPIISEFMASNSTTLADAAGEYPDWLELYNPTSSIVTLTGDYLTDSTATLNKWQIPVSTLAPGGFLVVFADSENETDSTGVFHTNFNIGASGGYLALVAANGTTVLSAYTYTQQQSDVAYGIGMSAAGSTISYGGVGFLAPTPRALNGPVIATTIAGTPTFNYPSGFYSTSMQVKISSATAGASIYYTLDGTAPSATHGTLYTAPITVAGESDIRAIAIAPNALPSAVNSASYIYLSQVLTQSANGQAPAGWPVDWGFSTVHYGMDPDVVDNSAYNSEITQDLLDLPSVSLSMNLEDLFDPETGIYSESQNSNGVQRPGSIELINPSGAAGFQADVGVSLKGDSSALFPDTKHGFDIHFSSQYGVSELDYPLFGSTAAQSFKEIELRTDQENSWSYVEPQNFTATRDELTSSLLAATGQAAEHYKVCFLYIDGMFWGLYDIIEKPDADFAASYYGGSASGYDALKAANLTDDTNGNFGVEALNGNLNAWDQLYTDVSTLDLSNNANYEMIQGNNPDGTKNAAYSNLLDVNNLINYMLVMDYVGNMDGPYNPYIGPNNFYAIRPTDGSFGFRFIATDSESTLQDVNENVVNNSPVIASALLTTPTYIFESLEANSDFRVLVGDTIQKDFFNGGPMSVTATTALFNSLAAEVQGPVVAESARWGDALRPGDAYTRNTDWQTLINSMLSNYFPQRTSIVVGQFQAVGLYPLVPAPVFSQYGGVVSSGYPLTMSIVGIDVVTYATDIYYTLDGSDPLSSSGTLSSTAILYTGPVSLFTTTEVKARIVSNGSWSALVDETFITSTSTVRITQLNYDPAKPPSGSSYNNDDFEFVELENFSSQSVNLTGVAFTDGITYTFGNVTLGPGQSGVLVHNLLAFESRYGNYANVLGSYQASGDSFSNSGEDVELVDASGNILDHFDYTACIAAYPNAHGKGLSLIVANPDGTDNLALAASWRTSAANNGTIPLLFGGTPTYLKLDANGLQMDVWNAAADSGSPAESYLLTGIDSVAFQPAAAGDSLTIDFSSGNPVGTVPLVFNGGTTPSALTIIGSANADTLTVNASTLTFSNTSSGSKSISYFNASNITFIGNGGADTLTQAAQPGNGATLNFVANATSTLNIDAGTYSFAASSSGILPITLGTLFIGSGAAVDLVSSTTYGSRNVLVLSNLSIAGSIGAWTGQLDLGNNDLIVKGGNIATISDQLESGFTGDGYWNGEGITSSAAADDSTFLTTLGYETGGNVFDGVTTTAADFLIKYTYYGDANLDGKVDASDYSLIDSGYLTGATGWFNGDFNHDGVVNGSDYTLIDNAFNSQGASLASEISSLKATPAAETIVNNQSRSPKRSSYVASVFQTQMPITFAESSEESIEFSMQRKDLLDSLALQ